MCFFVYRYFYCCISFFEERERGAKSVSTIIAYLKAFSLRCCICKLQTSARYLIINISPITVSIKVLVMNYQSLISLAPAGAHRRLHRM